MTTILHDVISAKYIEPSPSTCMEIIIDATIEGERDEFGFVYRHDDPFGDMNPQITAWFFDHPEFEPDEYVEPPEPEPVDPLTLTLTRRQVIAALIVGAGITEPHTTVESAIGAISDPTAKALALNDWRNAPYYKRDHPLFGNAEVLAAMNLTSTDVDNLWAIAVDLPE